MAWIWIDYFRQIDIFEKDHLVALVSVFLAGGASVLLVDAYHAFLWPYIQCDLNGHFLNDFLYCFLSIGLVEEVSKMTPFILFLVLFQKQVNEPIDMVLYASLAALGFSAVENVYYFYRYGFFIMDSRAIWCTIGHMFFGAVFAYGIVLVRYRKQKPAILIIPVFIILAALLHGVWDFILMFDKIEHISWILSPLFYFIIVSFFATILNNALNNSTRYADHLAVDSDRISDRLLTSYLIVFGIQFLLTWLFWGLGSAIGFFFIKLFLTGSIIIIVCIRLSRMKIIPGRWSPFRLELPFGFFARESFTEAKNRQYDLRIKGSNFNEVHVLKCLYKSCRLIEITAPYEERIVEVISKEFFANDDIYFRAKLHPQNHDSGAFVEMILKPKVHGKRTLKGMPVVGVFNVLEPSQSREKIDSVLQLKFLGWARLAPLDPKNQ